MDVSSLCTCGAVAFVRRRCIIPVVGKLGAMMLINIQQKLQNLDNAFGISGHANLIGNFVLAHVLLLIVGVYLAHG